MIPSEEHEDIVSLCPHGGSEIRVIHFREVYTLLGKRYVYFCPHCRKIFGVSHRKGFWMG